MRNVDIHNIDKHPLTIATHLKVKLCPAKYKDLDFITIDKLCKINPDFEKFIENVEKYITADARYISALGKELSDFCDSFFTSETESAIYCKEKNIPLNKALEEFY